jgi:hypothetical protein
VTVAPNPEPGRARAVFDLRLRIEADDPAGLWRLAAETLDALREQAPDGVEPRWIAMRPARRSPSWQVNIQPAPRRRRT